MTIKAPALLVVIPTPTLESRYRYPKEVVLSLTISIHPEFTVVFRAPGDPEFPGAEVFGGRVDVVGAGLGLVAGKRSNKAILSFFQLSCVSSSSLEYQWRAFPLKQVEM